MATSSCASCATPLQPGQVFFRARVTINGEQEIGALECIEPPGDLLEKMVVEGDWERYESEVHWEEGGDLCSDCRVRLMETLESFFAKRPDPSIGPSSKT